jgi:hypothetical protein
LVAGTESRAEDASDSASRIAQELARFLPPQRRANRQAAAAKKEIATCLKQAKLALTSFKAGPKSEAAGRNLLATAQSELEGAQLALELLDGLAEQTETNARDAAVQLDGDDEFEGLAAAIQGAKQQIEVLASRADALPLDQRKRARAEVARVKRELPKLNAGLVKARKLERDLAALVAKPASLSDKSEVSKALAEVAALSKRATSACDLRSAD